MSPRVVLQRWMKPDLKWRTPTPHANSKEKHTKLNTTVDAQFKKIDGVFVFGCEAREVTRNKCSLLVLQELPSPQDVSIAQIGTRRVPKLWSKIGKFNVGTEKTTRGGLVLVGTKKR